MIGQGETDISLTNQLAESQLADKTTRWQTKSLTNQLADSQFADADDDADNDDYRYVVILTYLLVRCYACIRL